MLNPAPILFEQSDSNPGPSQIAIIWPYVNGEPYDIEVEHLGSLKVFRVISEPYEIKFLTANRSIKIRCCKKHHSENEEESTWSEILQVRTKLPTPQNLTFGEQLASNEVIVKWNIEVPQVNENDNFQMQLALTSSNEPSDFNVLGEYSIRKGQFLHQINDSISFFWIRLITQTPSLNVSRWSEPIYLGRTAYFIGGQSNLNTINLNRNVIHQIKNIYKGNI